MTSWRCNTTQPTRTFKTTPRPAPRQIQTRRRHTTKRPSHCGASQQVADEPAKRARVKCSEAIGVQCRTKEVSLQIVLRILLGFVELPEFGHMFKGLTKHQTCNFQAGRIDQSTHRYLPTFSGWARPDLAFGQGLPSQTQVCRRVSVHRVPT